MEIVEYVEEGQDRSNVLATTYQMRNFYLQFRDGFVNNLDVMNYIQHEAAVNFAKENDRVLDMCCGRGLVLPLFRYFKPSIESYTGVDIKKANATFRTKRVTDGKAVTKGYYPFKAYFVEHNVASMSEALPEDYFTYIIYTASIEHMHPSMGYRSLQEAYKVAQKGARMFLTCPNTEEGQSGYNTRYKAHVYEWSQRELEEAFKEIGWTVEDMFGLLIPWERLRDELNRDPRLKDLYERQRRIVPWKWLSTVYAITRPSLSSEIGFILRSKK